MQHVQNILFYPRKNVTTDDQNASGRKIKACVAGNCKMFIGPSDLRVNNFYRPELDFTGQDLRTCG